MKFKVQGKIIDLNKKQLNNMIKQIDRPKYTIFADMSGIDLMKNGIGLTTLLHPNGESDEDNLTTLPYKAARAVGDDMKTKEKLDYNKVGFTLVYDLRNGKWKANDTKFVPALKHFKTQWIAEDIANALNESKDMKKFIERETNK